MPSPSWKLVPVIVGILALLGCGDSLGPAAVNDTERSHAVGLLAALESGSSQYEVVAIGTLGGATGFARGINNRNEVVGAAQNAEGDLRAFRWYDGTMVELKGLGGSMSGAYGINNQGLVVGAAETPAGHLRAVVWSDGQVMELGTLGGQTSVALAVNERGQVVGRAQNSDGDFRPFLWSHGQMRELPLPPGKHLFAAAYGINRSGDVVGEVWPYMGPAQQAVLWSRGSVTVLQTACGETLASDVNERGYIIGNGVDCPEAIERVPLLWAGQGPSMILEPLGGLYPPEHPEVHNIGRAGAINSRGQIVGSSTVTRGEGWMATGTATMWLGDDVLSLGGETASQAWAINDRGVAAGTSGMAPAVYVPSPQLALMADHSTVNLSAAASMSTAWESARALMGSRSAEEWAVSLCGAERRMAAPPTVSGILAGC